MRGRVLSVNIGQPTPNPFKRVESTGHHKRPVDGPVPVSAPGPIKGHSGLAGDFIGDHENHGGNDQAVYAFQREDLDRWQQTLGRHLPNGSFGENLTTQGIDINEALIGEQWRIGDDLVLEITGPRIPCATFQGTMERRTWLKEFTKDGRPGVYFRVIESGEVAVGDEIEVIRRPDHDISVARMFRAIMTDKSLLDRVVAVRDQLPPDLVDFAISFRPDLAGDPE